MTTNGGRPLFVSALLILPLCVCLTLLFAAPTFTPGLSDLKTWFWGGLHLWPLPPLLGVLVPLVPLLVLLLPDSFFDRLHHFGADLREAARPLTREPLLLIAVIFLVLWIFRSTAIIFGDGVFYTTELIPTEAFSTRHAIIRYDSVGTTMLYSWGFYYAKELFQLDPLTWYNIFGSLCTTSFFAWLIFNRHQGWRMATPAAVAILFVGNWSQTTFGAPEHYGQVSLSIVAFAILGWEALYRRIPLWMPCLAFCIGAFFHLIISWIFPALLWLIVKCWKNESRTGRELVAVSILTPALMTGIICYWMGFDLTFLTESNAGLAKLIPFIDPRNPYSGHLFQYTTFDPRHLVHIATEILLMGWPGIIAVIATLPLLNMRTALRDPAAPFFGLIFVGALAMNFLWNPELEFWRDQDLFSIVGLATCLLGAWLFLGPATEQLPAATRTRLLAAIVLGGLAWRLPVLFYHSMLTPTYSEPELGRALWPFLLKE